MKYKEILKYSDPIVVRANADKYIGDIPVYLSTRKDKKYMIKHNNKWVHFGQMLFKDYTLTKNEKKKINFQKRNHKWKDQPKYTPAWLSYNLLWT
jgi:hypothetical protein